MSACQMPTDSKPLTSVPVIAHNRVALKDFRPTGAWLWDGPSECIRRDLSVPGAYDSATVYLFAIAAPSGEKIRSSVQVQFDRNKRLILYQESRDYALVDGTGSPTNISISTGYGRQGWWRGASVSNYRFDRGVVTAHHARGSAEEIFDTPRLGSGGLLLRLTLAKCNAGEGFDASLPSLPPAPQIAPG
jgi:hypothetical protein